MEITIQKIEDKNTVVPVNYGENRIDQIKNEIRRCTVSPSLCRVEVYDMWDQE